MTDKHHTKPKIKHEKRHHKWLMAPFRSARSAVISVVLMSAVLGGIYTILNSSAANVATTGGLYVLVLNSDCPNGGVAGCNRYVYSSDAVISVVAHHEADGRYIVTWESTNTCHVDGSGAHGNYGSYTGAVYSMGNCYVWLTHAGNYQYFQYYYINQLSIPGWHVVGGGANVGSQVTVHTNGSDSLTVYMQSNDHDGDGVPYTSDACNDTPGKADSKAGSGCPYPSGCGAGTLNNQCVVTLPSGCGANTKNDQCAPPPSNPSGSTTQPAKAVSTGSRTVARTTSVAAAAPSVTASADKQPPTAPTGLNATEGISGSVDLAWSAATDDVGVTAYIVERSDDDGQTWNTLTDSIQDTNYTDGTTDFSTKYSYRVSAIDAAGNASDYAVTDITTSSFTPNAYADKDSTIESDDGIVSVKIPKGALSEDAACEINQSTSDKSVSKAGTVLAGAYELVCKTADGTQIDQFDKALEFKVTVSKKMQKSSPQLYVKDNGKWVNSKLKLNNGSFNFSTDSPKPFAVIGKTGGLSWLKLLIGLFLIIGAIFGIITWIRRRRQLNDYYDSLNSQYATPTPVVSNDYASGVPQPVSSVPDPFMPQPIPEPQPVPDQQIGHRTVFSPAIGSSTQPQVPTQPQPQNPVQQPQAPQQPVDPNNPYNQQPPAGPQPPA